MSNKDVGYMTIPGINISVHGLLDKIQSDFNVDVRSDSKKRDIAECRFIAMYIYTKRSNLNYSEIAELCGNRKRCDVYHALKTVKSLLETSREFRDKYRNLLEFYNITI